MNGVRWKNMIFSPYCRNRLLHDSAKGGNFENIIEVLGTHFARINKVFKLILLKKKILRELFRVSKFKWNIKIEI
jgi:hypothetical protein